MKKLVFTFLMVVGLALVAGTAMAVNESTVVAGGTYTYELSGVYSNGAATATVDYDGNNETITEVGSSYTIAAATSSTVSFTIQYGTVATPATSGIITVEVSDGTCSNFIEFAVTVTDAPTIDLAVADAADYGCQDLATSPLTNNTSAAEDVAASSNSFIFDISATITDEPSDFDATANIAITGGGSLTDFTVTYSGDGSYSGGTLTWDENDAGGINGTFTVTFTTTTGLADQTINLTASNVFVTENGGGADYDETATANNDDDVVINAVPTIGKFN